MSERAEQSRQCLVKLPRRKSICLPWRQTSLSLTVSSINRGVLIAHSLGSHLLWLGQETPNPGFLSQAYWLGAFPGASGR